MLASPVPGNRNRRGSRIHHVPGMPYYEATRAEEVFCTEADAWAGLVRFHVEPQEFHRAVLCSESARQEVLRIDGQHAELRCAPTIKLPHTASY
jgi:hypothetical protein